MDRYSEAGVDLDLAATVKAGLRGLARKSRRPEVLGAIGGFGGLFRPMFSGYREPVLVASIDGVGTKLKVAVLANRHQGVGEDLVHHCVNDIATTGAVPLFFLDYVGTSRLDPNSFRQILRGMARACRRVGCALLGGETAQMPGMYRDDEYDLVGVIVGVVDRQALLPKKSMRAGDLLIGLRSNGLHTNGYSLARKILFEEQHLSLETRIPGCPRPLGEELLRVHRCYLPELQRLRQHPLPIKGIAHITGGGLLENLPRILPKGLDARIELKSWRVPALFRFLSDLGHISQEESYRVFNMGIGMVLVVSADHGERAADLVHGRIIGRLVPGKRRVLLC
ncbi:phosphoribosylformylglycinamidine cyclo-ligase [Methylacidimicrobium cyclopophantes]|uniref:Phosphoribosylformylglycinamidine cyclo-ligase n=1 Tax=Methylacidimicrobium cyclopophantes TaxID=1041766 RepID=A0A5E6M886_9BACT|nr:phosphoribosylformylglycinamidine cyclo-ligase [Methylacidimicrobium cyclopophantes]VVM05447.1 phosphoribosylformylglycinamidine cyclo-ligase [Methylacidimicrobium cyclopophantes]